VIEECKSAVEWASRSSVAVAALRRLGKITV
jgi:hypothetical protein